MTRTNKELGIEIEEIIKIMQLITSNISSLNLRVISLEQEVSK